MDIGGDGRTDVDPAESGVHPMSLNRLLRFGNRGVGGETGPGGFACRFVDPDPIHSGGGMADAGTGGGVVASAAGAGLRERRRMFFNSAVVL